jgi:putative membrane protein
MPIMVAELRGVRQIPLLIRRRGPLRRRNIDAATGRANARPDAEEIIMMTQLAMYPAYAYPGWGYGHGVGGPGWWLIFPILFWALVLSVGGYVIYRRSPRQQARTAAERTLAERYARGEISEEELRQRRDAVRAR